MSWSHRKIQIKDRTAQVLIDDRFSGAAPFAELPTLNWIGVYCRKNPDGAFWDPEETTALDALEDRLVQLAEQHGNGWAVYVMRIDSHGIREYFLYSGQSADIAMACSQLKAAYPEYRIEFERTSDPEWKRYRTFLP